MSIYSPLKIELINTGDQNNTWGITTNLNLGTALEEAIVGRASVVIANPPASPLAADLTLVNSPSSQVARHFILNITSAGTLASTQTIQVPSINKPYIIENNTTGGQALLIKTSGGTGVTVPAGTKTLVYAYNNGVSNDVVYGINYLSAPTITGGTFTDPTLSRPLTNGGKVVVSALGTLVTGTTTINLAIAQVYTATITALNTITFAFSNAPAAGQSQVVLMRLTNGGSGTIVWPVGTKFANGGATPSLTVSGVDMLGIYYDVTTTTYMVFVVGTDIQ
jgi:hypothetical protein